MKTLGILLLVTLIHLLLHTSASEYLCCSSTSRELQIHTPVCLNASFCAFTGPIAPGLLLKGGCCPGFKRRELCKDLVKHVALSPDYCRVRALLVVTITNRTLCLDPSTAWSKKRLQESLKQTMI
ncbi:eotaxin-like [Solea senegalensis]|uniref:Eotaxin-like n=1 Tax=Solea senegalensis TaxID=28829 RepID=A0AAV6Q4T1_SOLSE|nr:eotaxin-like [Solea senegalensis]